MVAGPGVPVGPGAAAVLPPLLPFGFTHMGTIIIICFEHEQEVSKRDRIMTTLEQPRRKMRDHAARTSHSSRQQTPKDHNGNIPVSVVPVDTE